MNSPTHTSESGYNTSLGKSDSAGPPAPAPLIPCPECGSTSTWKDGLRYVRRNNVPVQRWLCRTCGFRYSEGTRPVQNVQNVDRQALNSQLGLVSTCRVCVSQTKAMINLATVETRNNEKAAGATLYDQATIKGLIVKYMAWLEKEGYCVDIQYPKILERLSRRGANLQDPESVKEVIMKQPWKDGMKIQAVYAYDALAKMLHLQWTLPKLRQEEHLPFIPDEKELDALIVSCQRKLMATYLQTLKETFADPGEALKLRWIDMDAVNNTVTINKPVKRHNPRQLNVSSKLIAMLNLLPKTSERIFPRTYKSISQSFWGLRKRTAKRLNNPRLLSISLTTFRHWGATMTYHYTRDILLVQKLLGHKHITNTMKYTQLISFKDDEFDVATATTVEEAKQLASLGFEKFDELQGIHIYRRPKRFGKLWVINSTDRGINSY